MLTLIAAYDRNKAIGRDGGIPWRAPEDLAYFQRETLGGVLIMGRRTWDSLPVRPLKSRTNIVVSSNLKAAELVVSSPRDALALAASLGSHRVYGIGGASIYQDLLARADRLLLTTVDLIVTDADTYFPEFDQSLWKQSVPYILRADDPRCSVVEYLRPNFI